MLLHFAANPGQVPSERQHMMILRAVANFPEARVIAVLLAPLRITARGLKVAKRVGTNPDVGPGWRHCESPDPLKSRLVGDLLSFGVLIAEALARALAPDAWALIAHICKPRMFGCIRRTRRQNRIKRRPVLEGVGVAFGPHLIFEVPLPGRAWMPRRFVVHA
jgi:hypothetical protein